MYLKLFFPSTNWLFNSLVSYRKYVLEYFHPIFLDSAKNLISMCVNSFQKINFKTKQKLFWFDHFNKNNPSLILNVLLISIIRISNAWAIRFPRLAFSWWLRSQQDVKKRHDKWMLYPKLRNICKGSKNAIKKLSGIYVASTFWLGCLLKHNTDWISAQLCLAHSQDYLLRKMASMTLENRW